MKHILLLTFTFLLLSCNQEKKNQENIIGKWQTDSINFNGITIKGDLLKNDMLWKMEFKTDSTYQIYHGNDSEKYSEGNWSFENDKIEAIDQVNTKMQCEFLSENAIKLTYQKNDDIGIMYMSRKDFVTDNKETSKTESKIEDAKISGNATYASDGIPDFINVYAQEINSKKIYEHKIFDRKQGYFEMYLPDGDYIIFSTDDASNIEPNLSQVVKVRNGNEIKNINAQDLSISNFVPVRNESSERNHQERKLLFLNYLKSVATIDDIDTEQLLKSLTSIDGNWEFTGINSVNGEVMYMNQITKEVLAINFKGQNGLLKYSLIKRDNNFQNNVLELDRQLKSNKIKYIRTIKEGNEELKDYEDSDYYYTTKKLIENNQPSVFILDIERK
ncbi:MAG: hypothetical protein ACK5IC_08980 [Moheibacter sp.]